MNPTTAIWLASIAAAIHVLVGAIQSNSFNSLLAQFGIPAINPKAFPWIGLALGLAGGIVTGLQQGMTIGSAIATAVLGMFTGGASALHLETISRVDITPTKPVINNNVSNVPEKK
jgi:hypothetical protein